MQPISFEQGELVTSLDFLPADTTRMLAVGQINGAVTLHSVDDSSSTQLTQFTYHKTSCRCLDFCPEPGKLVTVGKDKMIGVVDATAGRLLNTVQSGHNAAPSALKWYNEHMFVTGDDSGEMRIWDSRGLMKPIFTTIEHTDYISDFEVSTSRNVVISVSGDCCLAAWDIRKGKLLAKSVEVNEDILSVVSIRGERKVAVGTIGGSILFYNWGDWGIHNDRWPALQESIDNLILWNEQTIVTGSGDGEIRLMALFPHKVLAVIGVTSNSTVGSMALHKSKALLASSSTDHIVRFWDLSQNAKKANSEAECSSDEKEENSSDSEEDSDADRKPRNKRKRPKQNRIRGTDPVKKRKTEFFADL